MPLASNPCEKPSVLTASFEPSYARLVRRKVEGETDETREQAIMEERMGEAFTGTERLTVAGRRLHPIASLLIREIATDFVLII